jgi:glycosyltransferase involved in cell wall biosynthesis
VHSVDVNIVPLQHNQFTDSKSELKFFEASAVDTITIASPTEVFSRVISDGVTGFLSSADQWGEVLNEVQNLAKVRKNSVAKAARQYALDTYTGAAQRQSIEKTLSRVVS